MNSQIKDNPLFKNDMDSICIGCNRRLQHIQTVSVTEPLPNIRPSITLFEGLQRLSNFAQLSIDRGPKRACRTCFLNTDGYLRFQTFCNKSVEHIQAYILHQAHTNCDIALKDEAQEDQEDQEDQDQACVSDDNGSLEECTKVILEELEDETNEAMEQNSEHSENEDSEENRDQGVAGVSNVSYMDNPRQKPSKRVECSTCHKSYRWDYLKYHERIHTGEMPHKCKECGKACSSPSNLWSHIRHYHNTDLPHLCPYCGMGFKLSCPLKTHIRVAHTNERPFSCKICSKSFKTTQQLKDHLTTHSDEKPFQCEKCPKRFSLRKLLRQHAVTHAEIRPIECTFCGKRFTQRHCLRSHQAKTCEAIHRT